MENRLGFAILFSGLSFRRHVNGLEFSYRALTERLGFAPENIQVLNFDGSLRALEEPAVDATPPRWPGDGSPYRMRVTGAGNRECFREALRRVAEKIEPRDRLFINTCGHGGSHGEKFGSDLITYPRRIRYRCHELCTDLAILPPHHSLFVLMTQCFSGGFTIPILDASPARYTFVATAAGKSYPSFCLPNDLNWDSFHRNFVAALGGQDADGTALSCAEDGATSARAAFEYATSAPLRSPHDSPEFAARPDSAADMILKQWAPAPSVE